MLGFVGETIFDLNFISLGYCKMQGIFGNKWVVCTPHGELRMQRIKRTKWINWRQKVYFYKFDASEMLRQKIDLRILLGIVVELWRLRLDMYSYSASP